jgi:hypothetical protein
MNESAVSDVLGRVSAICLALPEATAEPTGSHTTFRVRKKVFAYFLDNHHGDGIVAVCVKTAPGDNRDLARERPGEFYLPAYIGTRGWVGRRLDGTSISWTEVEGLLRASYRAAAPKTLAAAMMPPPPPRSTEPR